MNRTINFVNMYCLWVEKCLAEDKKWEELAFFKLGIDLCVRQKELLSVKWDQIDFPYVRNIKISKATLEGKYYLPREINLTTMQVLNELPTDREYIFAKSMYQMIDSIRESIGDDSFSGHMMRRFGTTLKTFDLQKGEE